MSAYMVSGRFWFTLTLEYITLYEVVFGYIGLQNVCCTFRYATRYCVSLPYDLTCCVCCCLWHLMFWYVISRDSYSWFRSDIFIPDRPLLFYSFLLRSIMFCSILFRYVLIYYTKVYYTSVFCIMAWYAVLYPIAAYVLYCYGFRLVIVIVFLSSCM